MKYLDGERVYTEDEILDVARKHMNEIALRNLLKTGLFGDIAVGMSICLTHIIKDLRLNSAEADEISDGLQTQILKTAQEKEAA